MYWPIFIKFSGYVAVQVQLHSFLNYASMTPPSTSGKNLVQIYNFVVVPPCDAKTKWNAGAQLYKPSLSNDIKILPEIKRLDGNVGQ